MWLGFGMAQLRRSVGLLVAATASALGCSGSEQDTNGGSGGAGIGIDLYRGGSSSVGAGSGSTAGVANQGCSSTSVNGCFGTDYEGEAVPLDIYVMFDQSGSMSNDVGGITRLEAVQRAAAQFLRDPESAGIGVGIGYFGKQPIGSVSCDHAVYAQPDVSISIDHEAVINSLASRMPTGETPTAASIHGACQYAQAHRQQKPDHAVVILLMTDGKPEAPVSCANGGCCPNLNDAVSAAAECNSGKWPVRTYVLGVGPELDSLASIAVAGGTERAYLVGNENVAASVLAALNQIRGNASIPCQLNLPKPSSGSVLDLNQVNVFYAESGCDYRAFYRVEDEASCTALGGWYYDPPSAPTSVKLCGESCNRVSRPGGRLRFSVGCTSIEPPR